MNKKVLTLVMSAVMVIGMSVTAFAADVTTAAPITVTEESIAMSSTVDSGGALAIVDPISYGRSGNGFMTGQFNITGINENETYYNDQILTLRGTVVLDGPQDTLVAYIDGDQVTFGGTTTIDGQEVQLASNEFVHQLDLSNYVPSETTPVDVQFYAQTSFKNGKKVTGKIHSNAEKIVSIKVIQRPAVAVVPQSFVIPAGGWNVDLVNNKINVTQLLVTYNVGPARLVNYSNVFDIQYKYDNSDSGVRTLKTNAIYNVRYQEGSTSLQVPYRYDGINFIPNPNN
jgi:hypothetical protein